MNVKTLARNPPQRRHPFNVLEDAKKSTSKSRTLGFHEPPDNSNKADFLLLAHTVVLPVIFGTIFLFRRRFEVITIYLPAGYFFCSV